MREKYEIVFFVLALGLLPSATFAADVCSNPGATVLRPVVATHISPPYPKLSQMTGEQGTTMLQVTVGKDGTVTDAEVAKSSGSLRLDQAAVDYVKANWRWEPPTRNCQPAEAVTRINIVWNLRNAPTIPPGVVEWTPDVADYPADALQKRQQGVTGVTIVLSASGDVLLARTAFTSGFPVLDDKAVELAKARNWTPGQMDGKPVATVIELAVEWKLPDIAPKK
jgi:TonB family protein